MYATHSQTCFPHFVNSQLVDGSQKLMSMYPMVGVEAEFRSAPSSPETVLKIVDEKVSPAAQELSSFPVGLVHLVLEYVVVTAGTKTGERDPKPA
jgi:hypothetical protein